jgi:hypothetical protein
MSADKVKSLLLFNLSVPSLTMLELLMLPVVELKPMPSVAPAPMVVVPV